MIKLNTPYHVAEENVTVAFTEVKNGAITGTYPNATLTGTLEGNVLSATFHNSAVNAVGLIELTFNENGFEGKWKSGLEPGPMRGKWSGECVSESAKDSSAPATLTEEQLKWIETKDSWDYEEAPNEWLKDKEFMMVAVKKDEAVLEFASDNLKDDNELILWAISKSGSALFYASERCKNDREVVLAAVSNYGCALEYTSAVLKNDKNLVLAAVANDGNSLEYASELLRTDREVILSALTNNGCALQYTSDTFKGDKDLVLAAVRSNGYALEYALEKLRNDKEVVIASLANDAKPLEYASDDLKLDKEVLEAAIKNDSSLAYLLNENLSEDQKKYLEEGVTLEDFDEEYQGGDDGKVAWLKDRNFVLEALRQDARILKHASAELKADRDLVSEAISLDWTSIDFADEKLNCQPDILCAKVISFFNGDENILISDEDLNIFFNGKGFSKPSTHIEKLLFKIEFLLLKNKEKELQDFYSSIKSIVNNHHECFWILQAVSQRLDQVFNAMENYIYFNKNEEATIIYNQVSALVDSFDFKLEFSPSIEFETYFNDSEINNNWDDCSWTDVEGEDGLHFTQFIMQRAGMEWKTESWSDVKFYNYAISSALIALQNYSLRHRSEGFDEENMAVCLYSILEESYEPIRESGNGHYGSYVVETIAELLLSMNKNEYDLKESDDENLEDFNGWQLDLKKVASNICNRDFFDDWPGASEFAKREL